MRSIADMKFNQDTIDQMRERLTLALKRKLEEETGLSQSTIKDAFTVYRDSRKGSQWHAKENLYKLAAKELEKLGYKLKAKQ